MSTMIRIQDDIKQKLDSLKAYPREPYTAVISRIIDSYETEELTDEDISDIETSLNDLKAGRYRTIEEYAEDEGINLS